MGDGAHLMSPLMAGAFHRRLMAFRGCSLLSDVGGRKHGLELLVEPLDTFPLNVGHKVFLCKV